MLDKRRMEEYVLTPLRQGVVRRVLTHACDHAQVSNTHNIGIQMNQKELTKAFRMISNRKKPIWLRCF